MAAVSLVEVLMKVYFPWRDQKSYSKFWGGSSELDYTPWKSVLLAVETCTLTNDTIFMAYHIIATWYNGKFPK